MCDGSTATCPLRHEHVWLRRILMRVFFSGYGHRRCRGAAENRPSGLTEKMCPLPHVGGRLDSVKPVSRNDPTELPAVHEAWLPREHPLHRPRHGGRQVTALVCALLFFAAPLVSWVFGGRAEPMENRQAASFPAVSDGWGFFTGLGPWATDGLPLRKGAVQSAEALSRGLFGEPARLDGGSSGSPVDGGGDDGQDARLRDESVFPSVIGGKNGWLYLGHDVSYLCVPRMKLERVIQGLNRWREVVERSGREFQLVFAPDKSTIYPDKLPDSFAGEDCASERRAEFWKRVPQATGAIDMREPLRTAAENDGQPIYHDIDTHWTHAGGIAMAYQLAEGIKPGVTDSWRVLPGRRYAHSADIPDLMGEDRSVEIQAYSLAPAGGVNKVRFVASSFHEPLRLKSKPGPGMIHRPTRMIADSFTQFASPYLAATFSDIGILHPQEVDRDPEETGKLLAEGEVVTFELSERFVSGGRYELLDPAVADRVGKVLAAHPLD